MGQEKRKHQRYILDENNFNKGRFSSFDWLKSKKIVYMQIYDVSNEGIGVLVAAHLKPEMGAKVGIEFTIPGGEQIACVGHVVRISDLISKTENGSLSHYKLGIKFDNLPKSYQKLLNNHLKFALKNQNQNQGPSLQGQIESLGIKIKTSIWKIPYPLLILLLLAICLYGMSVMVAKTQEMAKTKWWVKQAHSFSEHMREQELKEQMKQRDSE